MIEWLRKALGILTDDEVKESVERQPSVRQARAYIAKGDAVLEELERLEHPPGRLRPKNVHR